VLYDSSDKAKKVLATTINLMRPEDHLTLITVKEVKINMEALDAGIQEVIT